MNKERIKQITLMAMAFTLIIVGYLNYRYEDEDAIEVSATDTNELNLGDVQLVNSETVDSQETTNSTTEAIVSNDDLLNEKEIFNIGVNKDGNEQGEKEYFVETRLERDKMYSETLETYQKMLENSEVESDQKSIATQEITNITNTKNGIMIAENLIKNKGFEDVVILMNNGIVSVIVKSTILNQEQIAKIQNIVSRELNVEVQKINISNKN